MIRGRIYVAICLVTGKWYIGQTIKSIENRFKTHCNSAFNKNSDHKFHRAIRKYGKENFVVEEVMWVEAPTKQELKPKLDFLEQHFIRKFDTFKNGYNSTWGGDGTLGFHFIMPECAKRKISEAQLGHKCSENVKEFLSKLKKGKCYLTEEGRRKISKTHKGKRMSEESRKKMSISRKGKTFSEEHKKKISLALMGEQNGFYGKHHSEELKENRCKPIFEFSKDLVFKKKWKCISEVAFHFGVCKRTVRKVINKNLEFYGSYWKYEK